MMNILTKLWNNRRILRSILPSVYFNFYYLPFSQAIRLPILLYKPRLLKMKGNVQILGEIKFGIIRLGFPTVSLYPNTGIVYENQGGTIVFNGLCTIGNNSAISIGSKGHIEFGDNFKSTTTLRLTSYNTITFGNKVRLGWDILVMDTDFHKLTKVSGGYSKGYAPISIGSNNWFGNGCKIMKRTTTPDYCVVQGGTILSGPVSAPSYSVVGNDSHIVVKATGVWRNVDDDVIEY